MANLCPSEARVDVELILPVGVAVLELVLDVQQGRERL